MTYDFKKKFDFDARRQESTRIVGKYPDRVPVIVQRMGGKRGDAVPEIDKHKFLVPNDLPAGQFVYVIRKRIKLDAVQALYMFCGSGVLPATHTMMSQLYQRHKDEDGFLYISYTGENTFG